MVNQPQRPAATFFTEIGGEGRNNDRRGRSLRGSVFQGWSPGTRFLLIQKYGAFGGSRHATGVVFAEEAVARARDDAVAEIADWPGNDPEQSAEQFPAAAERHQDPTDSGGSHKRDAIPHEDQCVETVTNGFVQHYSGVAALQRSESQSVLGITRQQPVHGVIAQPANAVEEDGGVLGGFWFGI